VAGGALVDRAAPTAGVLRDVRRDLSLTQIGDKGVGVVTLVGAQCPRAKTALARLFEQV